MVRKYAEDGCEVFFCSRLFFCVFVPADFVFVCYLFIGGYPKFRVKMASGELSNFDAFYLTNSLV